MKLLEQYEELIERSPSEISYAWKGAAVIAYLISSVSAYACSILFGILWGEICGGHCYFWADIYYYDDKMHLSNSSHHHKYDWTHNILVTYQNQTYCNVFHFACLASFVVAVILLTMFLICGKGGHDTSLFVAPWRIVFPAMITSLIMMILTMTAVSSFTRGYFHFSEKLYQLAYQIIKSVNDPFEYNRTCEVFQSFTENHNFGNHDACGIYWMIQTCSSTMTWSWIASFFILLMRTLTSADFNLLKVKIYKMPKTGPARDAILETIFNERENSIEAPQDQSVSVQMATQEDAWKNKVL